MRNIFSIILVAAICTSCALPNSASSYASDRPKTVLQTRLYIAEGMECSFPETFATPNTLEALDIPLISPLVQRLVGSGIDLLSNALRKASGEDDQSLSVFSNETGAVLYNLSGTSAGVSITTVKRCIRILVADFPIDNDINTDNEKAVAAKPNILSSTLISDDNMQAAISSWLGITTANSSFTPRLYIEYEVNPKMGQTFTIEPTLIWYPKAVFGSKYKLVSLELTAQTVPAAKEPAFQFTTVFDQKDGQSAGVRLGRTELTGFQKQFLKGPNLSSSSKKLQEAYVQTLSDIAEQVVLNDNAKMAFDLAKMRAGEVALGCMKTAKESGSASGVAITQHEKLICDAAYAISIKKADNTVKKISDKLGALKEKKLSIGGALFRPAGAVNFTFKLTETTKPNKFLLALANALADSKSEIQPAISEIFLGKPQQDRIDSFSDEWDYQTKLTAYSVAKEKYIALVGQVSPPADPQDISTAFNTYRELGKELGKLAVKLGKPLPD